MDGPREERRETKMFRVRDLMTNHSLVILDSRYRLRIRRQKLVDSFPHITLLTS